MRFRRHGALPIASIRRCFQCSSGHSNGYKQYSTSLYPDDPEIAVLGGGITGLASAYYISKELPRAKITIYEAGPRVGGWMLSKRVEVDGGNILFEQGPRTLRPVKNGLITAHLVQELGMTDDVIFTKKTSPAARNRFIYYPDHLVKMPGPGMSPWQIAKSLWREPVFEGFALAALREAAIDQRPLGLQDESVGSFISRRFDRRIADNAVSAMLHGIYAGDVYKLSMKSLFPQQWRDEEEYGSVVRALLEKNRQPKKITKRELEFVQAHQQLSPSLRTAMAECSVFTFRNGLGQLVERLDSKLRSSPNISWRTNTAIKSIRMLKDKRKVQLETTADEPAILPDYVISTLFSKTLAALCHREDDLIIASLPSLARARAVTVMVVNLYYSTPYLAPAGFGYLIPRTIPYAQNPERALGVVFDSEYSPIASAVAPDSPAQDSVAGTKLTVMLGGHWWDDWTSYPSPEEGLQMAKDVLARHLGITEQPAASNVGLQKDCIPQYTLGHDDAMAAAHTKLLVGFCGQLRVAGNSYTGVGVNDCVRAAWDVARGLTSSNASSNTGLEYFLRKEGSELVDVPEDLL